MRILVVCLGSAGDVLPFVTLGVELKRRRHQVSILTNRYFQSQVETAGLDFVEMGKVNEQEKAMKSPHLYHPRNGFEVFYQCLISPSIEAGYKALLRCYIPGQTVIVASRYAAAARMVQDKFHIPTVSVVLTPYGFRGVRDSASVASDVNAFRSRHDLPPVTHVLSRWLFSPERVIGLFPAWFASPKAAWPPHVQLTDFLIAEPVAPEDRPSALRLFLAAGEPPTVFTPGTAMQHAGKFFIESAKACRLAGLRAVFVTPFDQQIPTGLSADIIQVRSASFGGLFRQARAVVHSGGIGTVAQALAAGVPQLIVPLAYDQSDNASRLQKLGVALTLDRKAFRSALVADRIGQLVSAASIRRRCRSVAARFKGRRPVEKACDSIESLRPKV